MRQILFTAFPDVTTHIYAQAAEGNKVWNHKIPTGTHLGDLFGILATHQKVSWTVIDIMTIQDQQITEHWVVSDFASLMDKLMEDASLAQVS